MWRSRALTIPGLKGGKKASFPLTVELVHLVGQNKALDLDSKPEVSSVQNPDTWRSYSRFLCLSGLTYNKEGELHLTEQGLDFNANPTKRALASLFQSRYRIFGEIVAILSNVSMTISRLNEIVNDLYAVDWKTESGVWERVNWLEVLGLVQALSKHEWGPTEEGLELIAGWDLITPQALSDDGSIDQAVEIDEALQVIADMLAELEKNPSEHINRNTYNIWFPSPDAINKLREIMQIASDPIEKKDLFKFITKKFNLKASSVESMMPFLKASDLIEETRRGVYQASLISRAWLNSGSDIDLVRILHAKVRFVGEVLGVARNGVKRNELYQASNLYGQRESRVRWIVKILLEAGLIEETRYLHLETTPLGLSLYETLPIADQKIYENENQAIDEATLDPEPIVSTELPLAIHLETTSQDPLADGKQAGLAFEEVIAEVFSTLGFETRHIGGSGDTDVVIQWKDADGKPTKAIIDGKSKSTGGVTHQDVNIVALESHAKKNHASYIAVVGHAFSGQTIRSYAEDKNIALISVENLKRYLHASFELGLTPNDLSLMFKIVDDGMSLDDLITHKRRELHVISMVIAEFKKNQQEIGDISPRDMYLLLRNSSEKASVEELENAFDLLSDPSIMALRPASTSGKDERKGYILEDAVSIAHRLHALGTAIEDGLMRIDG